VSTCSYSKWVIFLFSLVLSFVMVSFVHSFVSPFSRSLSLTFKKFDPCSGFLNQENGDFLILTGDASYLQPLLGAVWVGGVSKSWELIIAIRHEGHGLTLREWLSQCYDQCFVGIRNGSKPLVGLPGKKFFDLVNWCSQKIGESDIIYNCHSLNPKP
jgi:hypothetical protein